MSSLGKYIEILTLLVSLFYDITKFDLYSCFSKTLLSFCLDIPNILMSYLFRKCVYVYCKQFEQYSWSESPNFQPFFRLSLVSATLYRHLDFCLVIFFDALFLKLTSSIFCVCALCNLSVSIFAVNEKKYWKKQQRRKIYHYKQGFWNNKIHFYLKIVLLISEYYSIYKVKSVHS